MATTIGAQRSLAKVNREALVVEARAMGLTEVEARSELDHLAAGIRAGLEALTDDLTRGWPSEQVINIITTRTHRLETGDALGDGPATRATSAQTLDGATARRETITPNVIGQGTSTTASSE
jgi:hypothetical protein